MSGFPPSLIPALWNIGILHHEKAELRKHMRQSVSFFHLKKTSNGILTLFLVMTTALKV